MILSPEVPGAGLLTLTWPTGPEGNVLALES